MHLHCMSPSKEKNTSHYETDIRPVSEMVHSYTMHVGRYTPNGKFYIP